jgi:hypothetical protein
MKHAHTQFLPFELDHVSGVTGRNPCKKERLPSRFRLGNVLDTRNEEQAGDTIDRSEETLALPSREAINDHP